MIKKEKRNILMFSGLVVGILILGFVLAADPTWEESAYNVTYYFNEDSLVYYNFTINLTDFSQLSHLSVLDILWSEDGSLTSHSDFPWLPWDDAGFSNSTTGILKINSTLNNETGNFTINVHAQGITTGQSAKFEFIINATNDAPNFTTINSIYNLTQSQLFYEYINASDEEEHYPLHFDINFFNNCSLASWSTRGAGNCSIFNLTDILNSSASMNFTPTRNDVGTYWANITVTDFGENYSCPHAYCDNTTYEQNKTTYSEIVKFNIFSSLEINVTDCQNKIFQENQSGTCQINITTKGEIDSLNISSLGFLRNYDASVSNTSWFYPDNSTDVSSFAITVFVNTTPQKTEIGNWTINFTVQDITSGETSTEQIHVYVNRTLNDIPDIVNIENTNTSIDLSTRINLTVYDDDLLVPDKLEGYNETITFDVTILNQSNLSQELSLAGFDVEILHMPVSGTNRTEAKIEFTPNSSEAGNYTINITINDSEGSLDSDVFNLTIFSNNFPVWNQTSYSFALVVNSTLATTTSFGPINLTDGYVTDAGDTLTFTNDSSAMPSFNLSSEGMISFTPYKQDVGNWSFSVTATDLLGLQNTTTFTFNITNVNSEPLIETPITATNASVESNSNITAQEDNYTVITLWIQDDDFKISSEQKSYYNESLDINLTIQGNNQALFSFVVDSSFPTPGNNRSRYTATFTPNRTDVGTYNITINVTDASNSSDVLEFNLIVNEINDAPVLTEIANQTSAVNRTFFYSIEADDEEDGNQSQGNLVFNITFLNGTNFINNNETIFNTTSGVLNITFNDTQAGNYRINITVNDSENLEDSDDFWIYVYDVPNIVYPVVGENFSSQENSTINITIQANHSVGDNLTYEFYVSDILRNTTTYYGNGTNLTWQYTPNFTDETYGQFKNLTLIVYPANSELVNKTDLNKTRNHNINISHTNSPVSFSGHIDSQASTYNQDITIDLSNYFSDIDYSDTEYNQTINFSIISNTSPSYISASVSNWSLTLSSLIAIAEIITINASDLNLTNSNYTLTNTLSNEFKVTFTTPSTTVVPIPSGGGGTTIIPVSLKIIMPNPVSAYKEDRIVLPITLHNNGKKTLSGINLTSIIVKDNLIREDITLSFDKSYFSSLAIGKRENVTLTIDVNTNETGTFEITINASVKNPKYNDWGKLYLTIKKSDEIEERILFTQEFLEENPECIELEELLDEARVYFRKGDFVNTILKINQAINGCKNAISQQARAQRKEKIENPLYRYLLIATLAVFFMGMMYYSYRRMNLKRSTKENILQVRSENTLPVILIIGGVIGFIATTKTNITGFAINNVSLINQNKFGLGFILIAGVLGFLIFLNRKKIKKVIEKTKEKSRKKYSRNKIKGLINKKVYTDSGDYIGKINEIILGKDKINSLRIKLDSKIKEKNKIKPKGIIISYKYVKNVGHIVIITKKIKEVLSKKFAKICSQRIYNPPPIWGYAI